MTHDPDVILRANVAVLESRTQREHYPDLSAKAALPDGAINWIRLHWFDEESLSELLVAMSSGHFSALLIASGVLQLPAARAALNSPATVASIREQISKGMGLIVLSTFVGDEASDSLSFLPSSMRLRCKAASAAIPSNLAIRPSARARIDRIIAPVKQALPLEVALPVERRLLSVLAAEPASHHSVLAASDVGEILLASSIASHGRVFVTTLPLDQLRSHALHALLIRAVRSTGILVVDGAGQTGVAQSKASEWLAEQPPNAYLVRLSSAAGAAAPTAADFLKWPYSHFSHIVFDGAWTWVDLAALDADAIARRVENWGSVTSKVAISPSVSYWLSLSGETRALRRAQRHAAWMSQNSEGLVNAPLLVMRAACSVATAVTRAIFDEEEAPHLATAKYLAGLLEDALRGRLTSGAGVNVDGLLLPTAALVCIVDALSIPMDTLPAIRKWLMAHAADASTASLLQAAAWHAPLRKHPAVDAAIASGLSQERGDIRLYAMAIGLACFPGVGSPVPDLHAAVVDLLRADGLSPLGKALLVESLLAASWEWRPSQPEQARTLEGIAQDMGSDLRGIVGAALSRRETEVYLVATSSLLHLDRGAALGYRDLKIGRAARVEAAAAGAGDEQAAQTLLNAEVESRRLARLLGRAEAEIRRRERIGTILLGYGIFATAMLVLLVIGIYWTTVSGLLFGQSNAKELVLPAIPVVLGLAWYLLYRAFAPIGFIPKWLPGTSKGEKR